MVLDEDKAFLVLEVLSDFSGRANRVWVSTEIPRKTTHNQYCSGCDAKHSQEQLVINLMDSFKELAIAANDQLVFVAEKRDAKPTEPNRFRVIVDMSLIEALDKDSLIALVQAKKKHADDKSYRKDGSSGLAEYIWQSRAEHCKNLLKILDIDDEYQLESGSGYQKK